MHLLAAEPGRIEDGARAVDLGQTPGEIAILSAADTELASLAAAYARLGADRPSLRLADLKSLGHDLSVDLYLDRVARHAKLVIVRLLGGVAYWPYGVERLVEAARANGTLLALLPGSDQPDPELSLLSTVPAEVSHRLWRYASEGGAENARQLLLYAASLVGRAADWVEPAPLPAAGLYWPGLARPSLADLRAAWAPGQPVAALVFYRAFVQAGDLAPIDALLDALAARGLAALPIYVTSLRDPVSAALVGELCAASQPAIVLNATGFAVSTPGAARAGGPFAGADCPVLQVVLAGSSEEDWRRGTRGLSARDLAMNVALPEVDGRILARAVSFKSEGHFDAATECPIVAHRPLADRIAFTAELARRWVRLAATPRAERRIALVLANYPNRDGRIGNGVGLDTPAATVTVLEALARAGYGVADLPADGNALIERLLVGPTNDLAERRARVGGVRYGLASYRKWLASVPEAARQKILARWGEPEDDPFVENGAFRFGALALGNIIVGIQPARGYNIDPARSYHDPALVPPHNYLAFYAWLREEAQIHAIVHMGKHGNLEWLPGKALALSEECFPELAFGPLPHLYPFIVNDPGEGAQAKRRAQAAIVDHLTPPLTRAESYGPLAELEQLVDEYYEAAGVDPRRLKLLGSEIVARARGLGLDKDCGVRAEDDEAASLAKLDNHLCELKELQIRDGLHVFGRSPQGGLLDDLLVALVRLPRGAGEGGDASLLRALASDLELDFDPLDCALGDPWIGARPGALQAGPAWRTKGDTVERLEALARALVSGALAPEPAWTRTRAVLATVADRVRPMVEACGPRELEGLLAGLDGRFVAPGPSGAPTRGRLDVLPTGRNFYSVDTRTVPTPTAWRLGWQSATLLLERHRQEHGTWPKALALSAWGTANMRTGGDDIAQALALMGVRPRWDAASRRVAGFEILPLSLLDRPRVDVTLRISGFFRDAFPAQIDLVDSAARAVAALDEPPEMNPLVARVAADAAMLEEAGVEPGAARARASHRVFGSEPGAYGAGLQALIDERGWTEDGDLARAYLAWGGYAYGAGAEGRAEHRLFERQLGRLDGIVHNQDNREHDLLDSDDYYQFEGGLAAAARHLSGKTPTVYHNDHARPERPRIRTLEEEIGRIVRGRAVNPKWIAGVMRHGYKGAFEMAATVDYLFAFAATAHAVSDSHFDAIYEAYLEDERVRAFLLENNPAAAREMSARLLEAQARGLWRPRSNSAHARLAALAEAPLPETVE
ncbi:MAG TPA: cobaltochelatase subunit CobN [Alphaproteobacteria bacterium]|nr:cobaltochelatase subunit CobN [Alphaproteobacteria bacterium]